MNRLLNPRAASDPFLDVRPRPDDSYTVARPLETGDSVQIDLTSGNCG